MTATSWETDPINIENPHARRKIRRVPGLRVPVLPSGTLMVQLAGGASVVAGVYLQFGLAVTLIVSGAAGAVLGALREAGKI